MRNRAKNILLKEDLKGILVKLESISEQTGKLIKERQRLENLKRRQETRIEQLRATVFIKVFDELLDGKPHYPDPQRRDSEVICRLVNDPAYRGVVNSIRRAEIKLSRLKAQEQVFQTQTGRLQIEEKLLLIELENNH
jgi:transposase